MERSGTNGAHNLIGAVGANVASALFQGVGLAAFLLPFLLLAAAWRRVRSRRINAPVYRLTGLVLLVLSASALLALANFHPLKDASYHAGGLTGALISRALVGGLNAVGATILLAAIALTGLLLATNFSFARSYESTVSLLGDRFAWLRNLPKTFREWRQLRLARWHMRAEARREAKANRTALKASGQTSAVAGSAIDETPQNVIVTTSRVQNRANANGAELATGFSNVTAATVTAKAAAAGAGAGTASAKRSLWPSRGKALPATESAALEEMVRDAAVKRKTESPASGTLPFEGSADSRRRPPRPTINCLRSNF